jgi:hypothetical protein
MSSSINLDRVGAGDANGRYVRRALSSTPRSSSVLIRYSRRAATNRLPMKDEEARSIAAKLQ